MCDIYVCMYVTYVCKVRVTGVQMISYIIIVDRTKSVVVMSKAEGETVSVHLPQPFTHIPAAGRKILSSLSTGPMAPLMLLCIVLLY